MNTVTAIRIIFIALTLMQSMIDTVYGGDSASVRVSCIIPSIPGVNAPLIDTLLPQEQTQPLQDEKETQLLQEGNQEEKPGWIEQTTQVAEVKKEAGKTQIVAINTFYSR